MVMELQLDRWRLSRSTRKVLIEKIHFFFLVRACLSRLQKANLTGSLT